MQNSNHSFINNIEITNWIELFVNHKSIMFEIYLYDAWKKSYWKWSFLSLVSNMFYYNDMLTLTHIVNTLYDIMKFLLTLQTLK